MKKLLTSLFLTLPILFSASVVKAQNLPTDYCMPLNNTVSIEYIDGFCFRYDTENYFSVATKTPTNQNVLILNRLGSDIVSISVYDNDWNRLVIGLYNVNTGRLLDYEGYQSYLSIGEDVLSMVVAIVNN